MRERRMELSGPAAGITVSGRAGEVRVTLCEWTTTPVSFVLWPAAAVALAEALEEVARPLLPGGVDDFRAAMRAAFGDGTEPGPYEQDEHGEWEAAL